MAEKKITLTPYGETIWVKVRPSGISPETAANIVSTICKPRCPRFDENHPAHCKGVGFSNTLLDQPRYGTSTVTNTPDNPCLLVGQEITV